ncbi:MAG: hypothetical protein K1X82_14675 [Bacteroidia bacterium]|nr:hypothetical protein [Bacteroidia bacterium]
MEDYNQYFILTILLFIVGVVYSRSLSKKALNLLSQDEKARYLDLLSGQSVILPMLVFLLPVVLISLSMNRIAQYVSLQFIVIFLVSWIVLYVVYFIFKSYQILNKNQFPRDFIRLQTISISIRMLSFLIIISTSFF